MRKGEAIAFRFGKGMSRVSQSGQVEVSAPARLHLGFLDLHGGLGRRFGSIGLTIEGVRTRLRLAPAPDLVVEGPSASRVRDYVERAARVLDLPAAARFDIEEAIPEHCGLGSGTQLGLAAAAGLARLHGRTVTPRGLADAVERGARSGIGIGAFASGGFLVDGGRGASGALPPVIAHLDFPEDWPILLIFDRGRSGIHGAAEIAAFERLPPFAESGADRLCRLLVMQLLPGIVERDLAAVSAAVAEIQARIGDHFAPAQGGRYASAAVAEALAWLAAEGVTGIGQSSWGPTGFALLDSADRARSLARALERRFDGRPHLSCRVVRARNVGAEIVAKP